MSEFLQGMSTETTGSIDKLGINGYICNSRCMSDFMTSKTGVSENVRYKTFSNANSQTKSLHSF